MNLAMEGFKSGEKTLKDVNLQFDNLRTSVVKTGAEIKNVNHDGLSILEMFSIAVKKFIIWQVAVGSVMKLVREFRDAINMLKEIDTLLVSIAKVTDMTTQEMKELVDYSMQASKEFGRTAQEFLTSVRDFSRAGFGDLATNMAELSMLIQNVGDVTADMANEIYHFHVDLYGNFIPQSCPGFSVPLKELVHGADPGKYRVFYSLESVGIRGLVELAEKEYEYAPKTEYAGKCDLCYGIRKHLVLELGLDLPDLKPEGHYKYI